MSAVVRVLIGMLAVFVVFVAAPLIALACGVSGDIAPMFGLVIPGAALLVALCFLIGDAVLDGQSNGSQPDPFDPDEIAAEVDNA